ncbi:MAG: membrane dipeptidase [Gemmatimonadetes bacterium]|nr:membrane dipeptidase [Gemmatimonadota bacterium]
MTDQDVATKARQLHEEILVFDGHNDTPVERTHRGEAPFAWQQQDPSLHMDLPRMREGGFDGGWFIVGNGPTADVWTTIQRTMAQIESAPADLRLALTEAEVRAAHRDGQVAVVMAIEGAARWLDGQVDRIHLYHRLGVRLLGITHGEGGDQDGMLQGTAARFGACTADERVSARQNDQGLTDFGRQVLATSNELGIVTDLAHINDRAYYEVLEQSSLPVVMSHTAVFELGRHWRCLTDDQLRALADAGGVMGIAFVPFFIDQEAASLDRLVDHIAYVAELVGVEHVGIGSDYDGMGAIVPVPGDISRLPDITVALMQRGFSDDEIEKIWGGNFLRVMAAADAVR